ncbi:unnamed protein product [Acanthoscelides obtectus]|uniref:Uncharacterized protein n=1 Tax=Acanthoscelides obtectus TaxID=200917 RepID=A0A9P0P8L0_ACAOB|nr:unnamed protein product [Acanthoscelides obtectus]CAK1633512.1 hypothetical protein AOBTE_LOCUS8186 [Acanthoscelides obtectus]
MPSNKYLYTYFVMRCVLGIKMHLLHRLVIDKLCLKLMILKSQTLK